MIADLQVLADIPKFGECYIMNATFIGSDETSSYWSVQFFLCFSLVSVHRQMSFDSGIRLSVGIIRGVIFHHQSANLIRVY